MFKMIVRNPSGRVIAEGESQRGEDWKATLRRLFLLTLTGEDQDRDIGAVSQWEGERWQGVATVAFDKRRTGGRDTLHVNVETDPPQF